MRIAFGSPYGSRSSFGGYRGFGGGRGLRLAIGAVIALIALISFFTVVDVNPFTGEEQRVGNITEEMEVQMGLAAAPEMAQQMGGVVDPRTDARAAFVHAVGQRLLDEGGVDDVLRAQNIPYRFSFTLLEDDEMVNAFALPGGPIFITEALLNRLENEAQLAGILGHEIGHVINRHAAERIAKSTFGQQLVGAVAVGAGGEEGGYSAAMIANLVNQMFQLKYSREDELESDKWGLQFLVSAKYDPREMVRVMEILSEAGGGRGGPEFMQTHPHPQSRIAGIEQFVKETFPGGVPADMTKGQALR